MEVMEVVVEEMEMVEVEACSNRLTAVKLTHHKRSPD